MDVYWFEQCESDVPADDDWLSPGEQERLVGLRFPKRRSDWRLGRWTAKLAVAAHLKLPSDRITLRNIEVRPLSSGAPEVQLGGERSGVTISLSHRAGVAACALTPANVALGCDLEFIEPRTQAFVSDYFTAEEQSILESANCDSNRSATVALLWSAKESALKALGVGLRADTRSVKVNLAHTLVQHEAQDVSSTPQAGPTGFADCNSGWVPLQVSHEAGDQVFHGWWSQDSRFVRTVLLNQPNAAPIPILGLTELAHGLKFLHRENRH